MSKFIEITDLRYNNGGFLINTDMVASITSNGSNGLTARVNFNMEGRQVFGETSLELKETYEEILEQMRAIHCTR